MKRYANASLLYALIAMAGGVFYREFTKFSGFTGKTALSVVHTHYFLLGMVFFSTSVASGKVLCFFRRKDGLRARALSRRAQRHRRRASRSRRRAGAGPAAVPRHGRLALRGCRHRASAAGREHGSVAAAHSQKGLSHDPAGPFFSGPAGISEFFSFCARILFPICDFMGEGFEISPLPRGAFSGNAFVRMTLNNGR